MLKKNSSQTKLASDGNTSFLRAARAGHLDKVLEHLKSNIDINTSNANGLNALHLASKDGHVDVVAELLKRGATVDAATKKGNTALHIASLAGQEEVVKLLVNHGASVNVQSQNGFTPLYMAAQENHDNVVKYLLANGANQSLATEDGFTPLAVAMQQGHDKVVTVLLENDTRGKVRLPALHIAAKKDDVKAAKLLLENDHNPDVTSKSGFTPLHIASHYGNESIANLLIQKKADVNYAAKHNITPLHVAAKWGKTNMVALLLEKGANIESKTRDGLTPLHCAARSGHEQVVDMLLEREAPISCKTKNGLAPLHMAAQGDHVDAARILLYHRAPVDEVTVDYLTALHVAAHCGHVRVAKLLLDRQADANARALNGFTPLHIACKKNRIKVVELLLKHGASISATTESGLTPLHVASFMGCMNIVIYLLQHDANPDVPTVRGETPLHLAARANQTDIIRILLRNGAQVDARAREQQTPLHIASRLGNVDIVMLLLQHGAKVDTTTKDMYTALHIAAKEGQDEVAGVLIENGASLNATTKKGFTPLHLAAKYGNIKVAKLLLQKEAPVDAQGKNGVTPLHVASHYDHQNVALLLLDKGASPHATAKNGHTPLHIAAKKNQMDIANTLLEYGAKPNAESKAGFTPLHLSAQEGHSDMSSLLIEHEADTNHQAKNGLTPLHLCAQEDRVPVAEILVKNNAVVDKATKAGYTPLHVACHYGQTNMVKFLLSHGADVKCTTSIGYTPLHQAAQQGHTNIVNVLLENSAQPNATTQNGQTPLNIAQKLGYITVIETLKVVTEPTSTVSTIEEKYKVVAPEAMHETFMSDSEEEGGEDTMLGDNVYRYLTADEMKSLGDDSLPIDVTRDERIDSNKMVMSSDVNMLPPQAIEDSISPQHIQNNYSEYIRKYTPDNVDIARHPINIGFLVSFLVDARGGAMRGCRHSGVRVIVPPRSAGSPTRITCRYVRPQRTPHPPPLMEGEALASRVLELGPVGAKFLGPVIIEVPHFAALRGKEREIVILRSDNGETWREHTVDSSEDIMNEVLNESFEAEDINQLEDTASGRITRILTNDFPQYFAVVSRIRQEVHAIGPEGGMVSSTVVPQVQAVFPQGALTKKIKVGLQAQPIDPELTAKLLGHGVAVSPVVTVEPRRRKFHKAITLSMPAPRAHSQGMINQYSGSTPTLRLLCSITGGTTRAQWEDVTGSTPLTFVNDCVSFTTTVSARFWLMDCRNVGDATKMATELYREAIHVPFMAKFVVFAKRIDPLEARLRVFCMTDDKEDKTLEHQEHFTEVAKSRDVEVLEGKPQYIEFAGNLVPITKSGEQLQFAFRAFRENRLPFSVRVKDQHAEAIGRSLFMREPKVPKGEPPQQPICILNIVLPDDIVADTISLTDSEHMKRHEFLKDSYDYYRPDPRLADMSNLLGEDWVPLATQLGLTTSEINVIKSEYPDSVAKQAQSMLRMWISQSTNRSQSNVLENALRRIGREDIIPQCLNEEQEIIKKEETVKYRTKELSLEDRDIMKDSESIESLVQMERKEDKFKKRGSYDKYSAEEKVVEEPSDEEDFNKTVTERREMIEKRLSVDRTIPASSQRVEIVQEITTIKRQSMVEDKIAEVEHKKASPPETKPIVEELKATTTNIEPPVISDVEEVSFEESIPEVKTTVTTTIVTETRTIQAKTEITHKPDVTEQKDADLLEGVTHGLEMKKIIPTLSEDDPKSPKLSKTPPPSPADFILREKATTVQEWDVSRKPDSGEEPIAAKTVNIEKQGKTTPPIKNEDNLDINSTLDIKNIKEQTNAFIDSESKPEPITKTMQEQTHKEEDKKLKKGFFESLKTIVTKSFDHSDSDSEVSQRKDKKDKKKKKKDKKAGDTLESPKKPRLPTPTEELEDIETQPIKSIENTASEIIKDVETAAVEIVNKKDLPTTTIEISKKLEPKLYESKDLVVEIKALTPIKEKTIFDVDIDKQVSEIENELLHDEIINHYDEPVLSEPPDHLTHYAKLKEDSDKIKMATFNLIQNEISFQGWADDKNNVANKARPLAPCSQKSKRKKLFGFLSKKSSKEVDDSDDDRTDSKQEIIEKQDREPSKEKDVTESKKPGFFKFGKKNKKEDGKFSDIEEPCNIIDNNQAKEQMDKQNVLEVITTDIETTKDLINDEIERIDSKLIEPEIILNGDTKTKEEKGEKRKSGIFSGIFGKKDKKVAEEAPDEDKLEKIEIDTAQSETTKVEDKAPLVEITFTTTNEVNEIIEKEITVEDIKFVKTDVLEEEKTINTELQEIEKDDKVEKRKAGIFSGIFSKKDKKQDAEQNLDEEPLEKDEHTTDAPIKVVSALDVNATKEFIEEEIKRFDDIMPIIKSTELEQTIVSPTKVDDIKTDITEEEDLPVTLVDIQGTKDFIEEEIKRFEDVKPILNYKDWPETSERTQEETTTKAELPEKTKEEITDKSKEEKTEKRKSGIFSGIFSKKDKKDDEDITAAKQSKPKEEEEALVDVQVSKEITVKSIPPTEAEIKIKDEKEKAKSSLFGGIFGKKEKKEESEKFQEITRSKTPSPIFIVKSKVGENQESVHLVEVSSMDIEHTKHFIEQEINHFEDVRPIVKVEKTIETVDTKAKDVEEKEEKEEKRKSGIFTGIFTKKEKKDDVEKSEPEVSQTVIKTPTFKTKTKHLDKEEEEPSKPNVVDIVEDIKPVATSDEIEVQERQEKEEKRKSGIFKGIFGKKDTTETQAVESPKKVKSPVVVTKSTKVTTVPIEESTKLSEPDPEIIQKTKSFVEEEINRHEDVKLVLLKIEEVKSDPEDAKDKTQEAKKRVGILGGIFSKKDKKEEIEEPTIEEKQLEKIQSPEIASTVDTEGTDNILDVTIIETDDDKSDFKIDEEKEDKRKSGIFGMFTKKDKKEPESQMEEKPKEAQVKVKTPIFGIKSKPKSDETVESIMITPEVLKSTNDFISEEIKRFEDVKLVKQIEIEESTEKVKLQEDKEEKRKSGIFSGIFAKKDKKDDVEEKSIDKSQPEEQPSKIKTPVFGIKSKKSKEDKSKIETDVLLDVTVTPKILDETKQFTQEEINRFEDVKLIAKDTELKEQGDMLDEKGEKRKSGILSGIFGKKDKKDEIEEKMQLEETQIEIKSPVVGVGAEEIPKQVKLQSEEEIGQPIVTAEMINNTKHFIEEEINRFEDVKVLTKKIEDTEMPAEKEEKRKSGIFSGIFGKKDKKEEIEEKSQPPKKIKSPVFGLGPKIDSKEDKPDAEDKIEQPIVTREVINNTQQFIEEEINRFEDVKASTRKIEESGKPEEKEEKRKSGIFSGIFGKKDKKEEIEEKSEEPQAKVKSPVFGVGLKVDSKEDKPEPEAEVIQPIVTREDINNTRQFIEEEINRFEDVKLGTKKIEQTDKPEEKEEKRKSGIFSGIFGKKDKKEEFEEKSEEPQTKVKSPVFGVGVKVDSKEDKPEPESEVVHPIVTREDISNTQKFIEEEINRFEDVKPLIKKAEETGLTYATEPILEEKAEKSDKRKSGILGNLFGKKEKKDEEKAEKSESVKAKTHSPVFGIKPKQEPQLSESVVKQIQDTSTFLETEVKEFEDVKITQQIETPIEVITSPKKQRFKLFSKKESADEPIEIQSEEETKDKKKQRTKRDSSESGDDSDTATKKKFRIFTKKGKKEITEPIKEALSNDVNISMSETTIKNIQDTTAFLTTEVNNYEDVRLSKSEVTSEDESKPKIKKHKKKFKRDSSESGEESDGYTKSKFKIFSKSKKGVIQEAPSKENKLALSEEVILDMKNTASFLKDEVENYHDVKTTPAKIDIAVEVPTQTTEAIKESKKDKKHKKKLKRDSSESGEESDTASKSKFKIFRKKSSKQEVKVIQEAPSKEILDSIDIPIAATTSFLETEVQNYEDVKPIVTSKKTEETVIIENGECKIEDVEEEGQKKSGILIIFGKMSKKSLEEHENSAEQGASEVKKDDSKIIKEVTFKDSSGSGDLIVTTDNFITTEKENYEDSAVLLKTVVFESPEDVIKHTAKQAVESSPIPSGTSETVIETTQITKEVPKPEKGEKKKKKGILTKLFSSKSKDEEFPKETINIIITDVDEEKPKGFLDKISQKLGGKVDTQMAIEEETEGKVEPKKQKGILTRIGDKISSKKELKEAKETTKAVKEVAQEVASKVEEAESGEKQVIATICERIQDDVDIESILKISADEAQENIKEAFDDKKEIVKEILVTAEQSSEKVGDQIIETQRRKVTVEATVSTIVTDSKDKIEESIMRSMMAAEFDAKEAVKELEAKAKLMKDDIIDESAHIVTDDLTEKYDNLDAKSPVGKEVRVITQYVNESLGDMIQGATCDIKTESIKVESKVSEAVEIEKKLEEEKAKKIQQILSEKTDKCKELTKQLDSKAVETSKIIESTLSKKVESSKELAENLDKKIKDKSDIVQEVVSKKIDSAKELSNELENLKKISEDKIDKKMSEKMEATKELAKEIEESKKDKIEIIEKVITDKVGSSKALATEIEKITIEKSVDVKKTIDEKQEAAKKLAGELEQKTKEKLESVTKVLEHKLESSKVLAKEVEQTKMDSIRDTTNILESKLEEKIQLIDQKLTAGSLELSTELETKISETKADIGEHIDRSKALAQEIQDKSKEAVERKLAEKQDNTKELAKKVQKKLEDKSIVATKIISEKIATSQALTKDLEQKAQQLSKIVEQKVSEKIDVSKEFVTDIDNKTKETKEIIDKKISDKQSQSIELAKIVEDSSKAKVEAIEKSLTAKLNKSKSIANELEEKSIEKAESLKQILTDKKDASKALLKEMETATKIEAEQAKEGIDEKVSALGEESKEKTKDVKKSAGDTVKSAQKVCKETVEKDTNILKGRKESLEKKAKSKIGILEKGTTQKAETSKKVSKENGDKIKEGAKDMKQKGKEKLGSIGKFFSEKSEKVKDKAEKAEKTATGKAKELEKSVTKGTKDSTDSIKKKTKEVEKKGKEKVGTFSKLFSGKVEKGAQKLEDKTKDTISVAETKVEAIEKNTKDAKQKTKQKINTGLKKVSDKVDASKDSAKATTKKIEDKTKECIKGIEETTTDAVETVSETVDSAKDSSKEKIKEVEGTITKAATDIDEKVNQAQETADGVISDISTKIVDIQEKVKGAEICSEQYIKDKATAVEQATKDEATSVKQTVSDTCDKSKQLVEGVKQKVDSTKESSKEKVKEVQETIKKVSTDIDEKAKHALEATDGVISDMSTKLVDIQEKAKYQSSSVKQTILDKVDKSKELVKEVEQKIDSTKKNVKEVEGTIKKTATDLGEKSKHALKEVDNVVSDMSTKIVDIQEKVTAVEQAGKDQANSVKQAVSDKLDKSKELVEGVGQKIDSTTEASKEKIKEVEGTIKKAATDLDEKSKHALGAADNVVSDTSKQFVDIQEKVKDAEVCSEQYIKDKVANVKQAAQDEASSVKQTISDKFVKAKEFEEGIKQKVEATKESFKQDVEVIKEKTETKVDTLEKLANKSATETKQTIKDTFKDAEEITTDIAKTAQNVVSEKIESTKESAESVKDKVQDVAVDLKESVKGIEQGAKEKSSALQQDLSDKIGLSKEIISDKLKDIKESKQSTDFPGDKADTKHVSIQKGLADIEQLADTEIKNIELSVKTKVKAAEESGSDKLETYKKIAKDKTDDVKESFQDVQHLPHDKVSELVTSLEITKKEVKEKSISALAGTEKEVKEKLAKTAKSSSDTLESFKELAVDKSKELEQTSKDAIKSTDKLISDKTASLKGKLTDTVDTIEEHMKNIEISVSETMKDINQSAKTKVVAPQQLVCDKIDAAKELTKDTQEKIKEDKEAIEKDISEKISYTKEQAKLTKEQVKATADTISDKIDTSKEKLREKSEDSEKIMKSMVLDLKQSAKEKVDDLKQLTEEKTSAAQKIVSEKNDTSKKIATETQEKLESTEKSAMDIKESTIDKASAAKQNVITEICEATKDTLKSTEKAAMDAEGKIKDAVKTCEKIVEDKLVPSKEFVDFSADRLKQETSLAEKRILHTKEKDVIIDTADKIEEAKIKAKSIEEEAMEKSAKILEETKKSAKDAIKDIRHETKDLIKTSKKLATVAVKSATMTPEEIEVEQHPIVSPRKDKDEDDSASDKTESDIESKIDSSVATVSTDSVTTDKKPDVIPRHKPLFRIESEDDQSSSIDRDEIPAAFENLDVQIMEALVQDLNLRQSSSDSQIQFIKDEDLHSEILPIKIEKELDKGAKIEGKLKRVERKFERMASEVIDKEVAEAKSSNITTPEMEEKQETAFQKVVSQLSREEVSDFQKEYASLWDEQTFSHTEEWDSKTPESQADIIDLPQGEASVSWQQVTTEKSGTEKDETEETISTRQTARSLDQHQLSDEMKQLLKDMEKKSKE